MADYATTAYLAEYWRPLSPAETNRANALLGYASLFMRQEVPDLDAQIAAGTIHADAATLVAVDMVANAMAVSPNHRGKAAFSEAKGPFSQSSTFEAGGKFGTLMFTALHRKWLGLGDGVPSWKFGGVDPCLRW